MKPKQYDPQYTKIRQQLYYLFTYYCSFADRDNYQLLKIHNYKRMLTDAQLLKNQNNHSELDLLFTHTKKFSNGINFQCFFNILPEIAKICYQNLPLEQRLRKIIHSNFHSLYEFIKENTDFGETIKCLSKAYFSQTCFILLKSFSVTLYQIYTTYFDLKTVHIEQQKQNIFKKLTIFSQHFQLCPQTMSKTQNFLIFTQITQQQADSTYKQWFDQDKNNKQPFKYFQFLKYLLVTSLIANRKIGSAGTSQLRKLINLLEIMEVSQGFRKICNTTLISCHLIPNPKLVKQLQFGTHNTELTPPSKTLTSPSKKSYPQLQNTLNHKFLQYYSDLRKKFIFLCLHGETLGNSFLTHKKIIDILKSMHIAIKQSQIEVYLASVGKSVQFQSFMLLLQKISQKKSISVEELIEKFLDIQISEQVEHERKKLSRIPSVSQGETYNNCVAIVQEVALFLKMAFLMECQSISEGKLELSFIFLNSYIKIMYDFEICPLYISKQSLIQIFQKSIKKSQDFMSFLQFKNSFITALPYLDFYTSQNTNTMHPQTKLIIIFERIKDSRGATKTYNKLGEKNKQDFFIGLRTKFKQFYPEDIFCHKSEYQHQKSQKIQ